MAARPAHAEVRGGSQTDGATGSREREPGRSQPGQHGTGVAVRRNAVRERHPLVLDSTAVRKNGVAIARRLTVGLEHRHGVLPGRLAGRLWLRTPAQPSVWSAQPDSPASRRAGGDGSGPANRRCPGLAPRFQYTAKPLAAGPAGRLNRRPLLRRVGDRAAAPALVFAYRPSARPRPLLPVRRE